MVFLNALQSMVVITLLCAIGFGMTKRGWVHPEVDKFIPRFLTRIAIPLFLGGAVLRTFHREEFEHMVIASLAPFASIVVTFLLFLGVARLIHVAPGRRYVFANSASVSNTIFIGVPVNIALFGDEALPYCILYFIANTSFFWTIGSGTIALEGMKGTHASLRTILKSIFSPPLIGVVCGILLLLSGLPVPKIALELSKYMGNLAMPLALIFIGITAARKPIRELHIGKDIIVALLGRLVFCPLLLLVVLHFFPLPGVEGQVFIIQAALPCMLNVAVIAAYYGADREFASEFVTLSTILGMLTIPLWMTLLTFLG